MNDEWIFDAPDRCVWIVSWLRDAAAWNVGVWNDDDFIPNRPDDWHCNCRDPGGDGVYESLDTIEGRWGGAAIPPDVRAEMTKHAADHPISESAKHGWGHSFGFEIYRSAPDGTITASFAPTWADDPDDPCWDDDEWPLAVGPSGRGLAVRRASSGIFDQSILSLAVPLIRSELASVGASAPSTQRSGVVGRAVPSLRAVLDRSASVAPVGRGFASPEALGGPSAVAKC